MAYFQTRHSFWTANGNVHHWLNFRIRLKYYIVIFGISSVLVVFALYENCEALGSNCHRRDGLMNKVLAEGRSSLDLQSLYKSWACAVVCFPTQRQRWVVLIPEIGKLCSLDWAHQRPLALAWRRPVPMVSTLSTYVHPHTSTHKCTHHAHTEAKCILKRNNKISCFIYPGVTLPSFFLWKGLLVKVSRH